MVYCAITSWPYWFAVVPVAFALVICIKILVGECMHKITDCESLCYVILRWMVSIMCAIFAIVFLIMAIIAWSNPSNFGDSDLNKAIGAALSFLGWIFFIWFLIYLVVALWFMISDSFYRKAVAMHIQNHLILGPDA